MAHKVFISYHHADQDEVDSFIEKYDHQHQVFISRVLGVSQDIIDSNDTDYVMRRIRELYLRDTTVTLVLVGRCTWARRYVDWELQSSLRSGTTVTPNGVLGIVLPSAGKQPKMPERLRANLPDAANQGSNQNAYARLYWYPSSKVQLESYIDEAFHARATRRRSISNPRDHFERNRQCS